ncbi:MAG TPA: branched-chain amino acid transaminase [Holophagaceae bacterium]|jgi:branched-chain amino acid aminotransferase|nr:branched-chain amino acid transaminase [Holophagaceae bacterium]
MQLWMDGALVGASEQAVSPIAHALHYGTGVFEGIRAYETAQGPAIFRLDEHLARLGRGAETLGMAVDLGLMRAGCLETLAASGLQAAYLRPLVFYETGGLGLDVAGLKVRHLVVALPWKNHLGEGEQRGVRVRTSSFRRNSAKALPPLKLCGAYVNSVLAKLEATRAGFEEALFVDGRGFVVECTGENVFLVKHGKLTAVESADALPGITRATVIDLTGAEIRPVSLAELRDADEIFLTGTSAEITPVGTLDDRKLAVGPLTKDLQARYASLVRGKSETSRGWLTHLSGVSV